MVRNIDLTVIPKSVVLILKTLTKHHFDAYIVGGAVRDVLMGKQSNDWDFTTNATPEDIQNIFKDTYYDNTFGTVGVSHKHLVEQFPELSNDQNEEEIYEITTYRSEGLYTDHRRPDSVSWGKTIEEDLGRRDFTINAMALKLTGESFEIVDLFHGQEDLEKKLIQTVGTADERFKEDALRMLRAIRFGAQLGFSIEKNTLEAIQKNHDLITHISFERIRDEFLKILTSNYPKDGILLLYSSNLLQHIVPELIDAIGVEQSGHHIYDVWTHSLNAVQECPSNDPIIRLSALLHDIGKPRTAKKTPKGTVTFYGHEVTGARMAKDIAKRLKLSNKEIDKVFTLVRWHMFAYDKNMTDAYIRRFIKRVGFEYIPSMMDVRIADRLGSGSRKTSWRLEEMKERIEKELHPPFSMNDMAIDGNDVMKTLHIKPGKRVGEILKALFKEVEEHPEKNTKEYLLDQVFKYSK